MKVLFLLAALPCIIVYPQLVFAQEPAISAPLASTVPLEVAPLTGLARQLRALQLVQDRMVGGNGKAVDAQRALIEQILASLETRQGVAGLTEKDAVLFIPMALLNGADPGRIRAVLGQSGLTTREPFLLGALAYAEGRIQDAISAFETVNAAGLSPLARAQFHLTFGVMQAKSAPDKAIRNFVEARLDAPGTLIEEAALRRQTMLEISRPDVFLKLVRSYLHRFAASPFASAFISQFAFTVAELPPEIQARLTVELGDLLKLAQPQDRQNFYSILARSSLIGGQKELADFATLQAVQNVTDPSQLLSARLYRAAFEIAGSNYTQAATELRTLMRVPLQASDREILMAAIGVAQELRRWPYETIEEASKAPAIGRGDIVRHPIGHETLASIENAQTLLKQTQSLAGPTP